LKSLMPRAGRSSIVAIMFAPYTNIS
jgi:hypothetical protein